jgi:hypothetical protein
MTTLRHSSILGRVVRQDPPEQLGKPTRQLFEEELSTGNIAEATALLDYLFSENRIIRDINRTFAWHIVRYILDRRGTNSYKKLFSESLAPWVGTTCGLPGQPLATVTGAARGARLSIPGAKWEIHVFEENESFEITLGSPDAQRARWENRRAEIAAAMQSGPLFAVRELLDEQLREELLVHDLHGDWNWALFSVICREWGEGVLGDVLRMTQAPWLDPRYARAGQMSAEEALQQAVEGMRGHFAGPGRTGAVTVAEEPQRFVMSFDPCGSGGRMRRGDAKWGRPSRTAPPYNFVNIEGAYPWTWNRKGVCAYCAHCAVALQIVPIERLGYPLRVVEYPDDPNSVCRWIIYKDRKWIPPEAYAVVGHAAPGS